MLGWLIDPFSGPIMQRALLELVLLGVACGPIGVWVLLYRHSYAAESLAHGMLPGLVLATLAGAPLLLGASGGVLVAAGAIALASRDDRLGSDVGVAVAIGALTGMGALLALVPQAPPRLAELLFGDPLGVDSRTLGGSAALVAAVLVALPVMHRRLALSAFDEAAARSLGASPRRLDLILLLLLAVTTVAAVQALGNLLTVALLLAPGAAALRSARRLPAILALAAALAVGCGAAGLLASYHLHVATGAAIALAAVGVWLVSLGLVRRI